MKQKRKPYRDYVKDINQSMDVFSEGTQHVCAQHEVEPHQRFKRN